MDQSLPYGQTQLKTFGSWQSASTENPNIGFNFFDLAQNIEMNNYEESFFLTSLKQLAINTAVPLVALLLRSGARAFKIWSYSNVPMDTATSQMSTLKIPHWLNGLRDKGTNTS